MVTLQNEIVSIRADLVRAQSAAAESTTAAAEAEAALKLSRKELTHADRRVGELEIETRQARWAGGTRAHMEKRALFVERRVSGRACKGSGTQKGLPYPMDSERGWECEEGRCCDLISPGCPSRTLCTHACNTNPVILRPSAPLSSSPRCAQDRRRLRSECL